MSLHLARGKTVDLLDDEPVATCDRCGRATWDVDAIGAADGMTQPDGHPCGGVFIS